MVRGQCWQCRRCVVRRCERWRWRCVIVGVHHRGHWDWRWHWPLLALLRRSRHALLDARTRNPPCEQWLAGVGHVHCRPWCRWVVVVVAEGIGGC